MLKTGTALSARELSQRGVGAAAHADRVARGATARARVSRSASPRDELKLVGAQHDGVAAELDTPTSNETRVRVEGFSKISATVRPASAREDSGADFSSRARSSRACSSAAESSSPVRKWRGIGQPV